VTFPGLPHQTKIVGSLQMDKQALLRALQVEIQRHGLGTFVDESRGGRGVVVPICPACRKRFNTSNQFVGHLANDVLPSAIAKLDETLVVTGRHLSSRT
jgi:hypothetical protein